MRKLLPVVPILLLAAYAIALLSCGSSSNKLQSVTITPATADARNYPNGQVQFTATGTSSNGRQVKPLTALWSPGPPWTIQPFVIVVDNNGLASCGSVPAGTYQIWAGAPSDPNTPVSSMKQGTPSVSGTAQLTCP